MKLLFVGDAYSVHTARWISQLADTGWAIHLFDPCNGLVHEDLVGVHLHTGWKKPFVPAGTRVSYRWPFLRGRHCLARRLPRLWRLILPDAGERLAALVRRLRPDVIHSLGMQRHSEAVLQAREQLGGALGVPWIYSCRGSDIYFFQKDETQLPTIRKVLGACEHYICNCRRDLRLAKEQGFRGEFLGFFQGGGGFPIDEMRQTAKGLPSKRPTIAVKGLQTRYGRAHVALEALRRCADQLTETRIVLYQAQPEVRQAARDLAATEGLSLEILPRSSPKAIWQLFGRSRLAVGISASDGVPNAMIEAMIMGAFPIQTDPGGASSEWIDDGVTGRLVPSDDPPAIAEAIVQALSDDALVDSAADLNLAVARDRVDSSIVRPQVLTAYRRAAKAT